MCATGKSRSRRGGVAARGDGASEVQRHPGGSGVPGWRTGRRIGARSGKAEAFDEEVMLRGGTPGSSAAGTLRVCAEDGEILEPVEAGETVVKGGRFRPSDMILGISRQPSLLKLVGDVGARQDRHSGFICAAEAEDGKRLLKLAFKVQCWLKARGKVKEKNANTVK